MRRLRAGLCLALSLLTAGLPSFAGELASPAKDAPLVRLETPALPALPELSVLPGVQAPLTSLTLPDAKIPTSASALATAEIATAQTRAAQPQAQAAGPTALASAQAITAGAASAQKAGETAQSVELGRVWTGERTRSDSSPAVSVSSRLWAVVLAARPKLARSLVNKLAAGAATGVAFVPKIAHAAPTAAAAAATPAKAVVPVPVTHFLAAYGKWVAGGAIVVGTYAASQAIAFVVNRVAKAAKWDPTTTVAVRMGARIATWTGGAIIAMHAAGVPTDALVTTFGLGSAGVSMAVKDFIGNTIEGAKVLVNQPFVIGDKVQIGDDKYTVAGMDLYYAKLKPEGFEDSVTFKPYGELAGSSIKVFRPYSTAHKTRLWKSFSPGATLRGLLRAPGLMIGATREMPRPDLKRASLWLGGGLALLFVVPRLEKLVLALLPTHLAMLASPLGWAAAALAAAGLAYAGYRLAGLIKSSVDALTERWGWPPILRRAAAGAVFGVVAAAAIAGVIAGFPVMKSLVAVTLVGNVGSVAGFLHAAFGWVQAGAIIIAARSAQSWSDRFIDHLAAKFSWNPQLVLALKLGTEVLSYVVGGSLALRQVGMTWGSLMKTLGATSAALGIAASDVLSNLFNGIWLLWRKPFRVGDWIRVNGYVGQVVDMTVQYVVLSQDDGTHVLVPQGVMKKGFTPLKTPQDVARAKALLKDAADQAAFVADLYKKAKTK